MTPRNFFKFSIHIPGFGRKEMVAGKKPVIKIGKASPNPTKSNIAKIVKLDDVNANVKAVPRNGAEHGVDRIVASTPEEKSPKKLSLVSRPPSLDPPGVLNSKSPKRFSANTKRTKIIAKTKSGDCSWNPHPTCSPASFNRTIANVSREKVVNIPNV